VITAIMQPYFFPYIGYFQLMSAVDTFVFFDDVQYIERGWVNRNLIRGRDEPVWLTMPVQNASRNLAINRRQYALCNGATLALIQRRLRASYARATCLLEADPLISGFLEFDDANVAVFNANLLTGMARQLDINCRFLVSSHIDKPDGLRGQSKVIDLCRRIGASRYVNPIGGIDLYEKVAFEEAGLELSFLQTSVEPTVMNDGPCHLSIIDHLMMRGLKKTSDLMAQYDLLPKDES